MRDEEGDSNVSKLTWDHFTHLPMPKLAFPRPSLVDVTLRDGGFARHFDWSDEEYSSIVGALCESGLSFVELGYSGGLPDLHGESSPGRSADLPLGVVQSLRARYQKSRFGVMVHPSATQSTPDFEELSSAGVELVRFVYHPAWQRTIFDCLERALSAGLTASINIALATRYQFEDFRQVVASVSTASPSIVYIADTNSSLFPSQVCTLVEMAAECGKPVGFHGHDFLSLGFANSIEAARAGASYVDVSLGGLGRSGGNVPTELWIAALAASGEPGVLLEPLLPALEYCGRLRSAGFSGRLLSAVSALLNLSPPEEDLVREAACSGGVSLDQAAARLLERFPREGRVGKDSVERLVFSDDSAR